MDHFKAKLVSIRASREKYTARGRAFPRKDAERLERNERKLEKARAEFQVGLLLLPCRWCAGLRFPRRPTNSAASSCRRPGTSASRISTRSSLNSYR